MYNYFMKTFCFFSENVFTFFKKKTNKTERIRIGIERAPWRSGKLFDFGPFAMSLVTKSRILVGASL